MQVWSAILGFIEVLVYVVGIGVVVQDLMDIPMLLSYCLGFSVGNIVGIRMEQRLAIGFVSLRIMSPTQAPEIAGELRNAGYGATLSYGEGRDGQVGIVTAVVPRKHSREAIKLVQRTDDDAFLVVDEARAVSRGWIPTSLMVAPSSPVNTTMGAFVNEMDVEQGQPQNAPGANR